MSKKALPEDRVSIEVENIGGIRSTSVDIEKGVTVLTGENATNRTSLLQAIMASLGSERATLKGDAEGGTVTLSFGTEVYNRSLTASDGDVHFDGQPYLDDVTLADLYAFLLENNEARRAIALDRDLREVIMRPIDTEEIEQRIRSLQSERDEIDSELDELADLRDKLPSLREKKERIEADIDEMESRLENKKRALANAESTVQRSTEATKMHESLVEKLGSKRTELQRSESRIDSERESLDSLQTEKDKLETKLADLQAVPDNRRSEIDAEINRLRGRVQEIKSTVTDMQSLIQFNEEFLEGDQSFLTEMGTAEGSQEEAVTDKLLSGADSVRCWTCGNTVDTSQIEATVADLQSVRNDRMDERQSLEQRIEELKSEQSTLNRRQETYERTKKKLAEVEAEIDRRTSTLETLKKNRTDLREQVENLEGEVEDHESEDREELVALQKEVSRLEVELDDRRDDLDDLRSQITATEDRLTERSDLEDRRATVTEEIADFRSRVEDLQTDAVEAFNTHMERLLEHLEYNNLERIWIEQTEAEVKKGRRKVTEDRFDLHIVRSTESGSVYEDTVDHLSESEREVTGLVFALAGYLVHEVHDEVPFMILDSIEAIDSDRIAALVEYLEPFADYLVVALLEEDAAALPDRYPRISSI